jgi:hypothetical protein
MAMNNETTISPKKKIGLVATIGFAFSFISLLICLFGYILNARGLQNYPMKIGPQLDLNYLAAFMVWAVICSVIGIILDIIGIFTSHKKWIPVIGLVASCVSGLAVFLGGIIAIGGAIF